MGGVYLSIKICGASGYQIDARSFCTQEEFRQRLVQEAPNGRTFRQSLDRQIYDFGSADIGPFIAMECGRAACVSICNGWQCEQIFAV